MWIGSFATDPRDDRVAVAEVVAPDGWWLFDGMMLSRACAPGYVVEEIRVRGVGILATPWEGLLFSSGGGVLVSLGRLTDVHLRGGDAVAVSARLHDGARSVRMAGAVVLRKRLRAEGEPAGSGGAR